MPSLEFPAESDWLQLWTQLARQMRQQLADRYAAAGVSESRAAVLEALESSTAIYTQTQLAADLLLSESNLCSLIERMQREGLVVRERSTVDRRKTLLSITAEGRDRRQQIQSIQQEFRNELQSRLGSSELRRLGSILDMVKSALANSSPLDSINRRAS